MSGFVNGLGNCRERYAVWADRRCGRSSFIILGSFCSSSVENIWTNGSGAEIMKRELTVEPDSPMKETDGVGKCLEGIIVPGIGTEKRRLIPKNAPE